MHQRRFIRRLRFRARRRVIGRMIRIREWPGALRPLRWSARSVGLRRRPRRPGRRAGRSTGRMCQCVAVPAHRVPPLVTLGKRLRRARAVTFPRRRIRPRGSCLRPRRRIIPVPPTVTTPRNPAIPSRPCPLTLSRPTKAGRAILAVQAARAVRSAGRTMPTAPIPATIRESGWAGSERGPEHLQQGGGGEDQREEPKRFSLGDRADGCRGDGHGEQGHGRGHFGAAFSGLVPFLLKV